MGSDVLNPLSSPLGHKFPLNNCNSIPTSNSTRCFSTSSGGRGAGGGRWESNNRRQKEYQRFIFDDELRANFKEDDFGFGSAVKQRIWWSDDSSLWGDDYEDEEAGFGSFGVKEDSIGFAWVTKVTLSFCKEKAFVKFSFLHLLLSIYVKLNLKCVQTYTLLGSFVTHCFIMYVLYLTVSFYEYDVWIYCIICCC